MQSSTYWIWSKSAFLSLIGFWLLAGMTSQAVADAREPDQSGEKSQAVIFVESDEEVLPGDVVKVNISQFKYNPAEITVAPGTTILWVNEDPAGHNAAFVAEDLPDLDQDLAGPIVGQGERFAVRFTEAGRYNYYCTPHPFMKGAVIVE